MGAVSLPSATAAKLRADGDAAISALASKVRWIQAFDTTNWYQYQDALNAVLNTWVPSLRRLLDAAVAGDVDARDRFAASLAQANNTVASMGQPVPIVAPLLAWIATLPRQALTVTGQAASAILREAGGALKEGTDAAGPGLTWAVGLLGLGLAAYGISRLVK